ncbi:MAG: helix-hairpin-helix domain-containing protein [Chloroherpetonaceae bacterium]|nr:helix-hairpin-helix domain-containing protein [Chloroherpetonaceae bacterium]MCS7210700.1 helix-hairpin-helix domain-containing protein [Chloroherpetonaceae bacterium]MDW8019657.1 helix-hairpin-helix domain-containing protein [Chloroherpetonaceae bacterium]MDW8464916.1 helix-hairpin-helix domain-containing protein [Chloroherpetonaceae bacterium]
MKPTAILLLSCLVGHLLYAQTPRLDKGARAIALGGAFTGLANSSFAVFYNPAGLALLPYREASFFYVQPFGLPELADIAITYADPLLLPQGWGSLGAAIRRFGFSLYNETAVSLTYARPFERRLFIGVSASYQLLSIQGYGYAGAVGLDIGILALITPDLSIGVAAMNLNRPAFSHSGETLAQVYMAGLSYRLLKSLRAFFDVEKDIRYPLSIKSGMEFEAVEAVALRAGFSTEPQRFTAGVGVRYSVFDADYALTTHPELGFSHYLTLSIRLGSESDSPQADFERLIEEAFDTKPPLAEGDTLNLNTATFQDLMRLPRMTRTLADRILRYRQTYKRFESLDELRNIRGVSEALFEVWKRFLVIEPSTESNQK